jgi:hypothetical protein
MKKTILICAAATLLTACNGNRANYTTVDDGAYIEAADSSGIMNVYAYEGNIKAHGDMPPAHYMVVISEQLDSVNGTYTMTTTYIEADTIKAQHKSRGKKKTHWGIPGHHNAKVYALAPDSGSSDSVYLYVETDTTVILLDKNKQQPEHPHHFRLRKKSNTNHHHSDHTMHHNDNKHHTNDTHHKK